MKALVKYDSQPGKVKVKDVAKPQLNDKEVLIEVKACGICGTDYHILEDEWGYNVPVVLGHEWSGQIVELGDGVSDWKVGDRVVGEPHTGYCGKCLFCQSGNKQICPEKSAPGSGINGAMAEFMSYPVDLLHEIPEEVSWEEAAGSEPLAFSVHTYFERVLGNNGDCTLKRGNESVLITGPGPIGLCLLQLARLAGASQIIVSGTERSMQQRLPMAKDLGADLTVNIAEENLKEVVLEHTNGKGVDIALECSGAKSAINDCVKSTRRLGIIGVVGISGDDYIDVAWDLALTKGLNIIFGMSSSPTSWRTAVDLLAREDIDLEKYVTHKGGLSEWREIFEGAKEGVKGLILPNA